MNVTVCLVSGFRRSYEVEEILENEDWVQLVLENGTVTFPLARIEWWEVSDVQA